MWHRLCTKSLSGLALKCLNQDNVTPGWHCTLGCVEVGEDGREFSCQNHYRPYIKKMPGCQESGEKCLISEKNGWSLNEFARLVATHYGVNCIIMSSCFSQVGREYLWGCSCLGWDEEALQLLCEVLCKYALQGSPRSCSHFCVVRWDGEIPTKHEKIHLWVWSCLCAGKKGACSCQPSPSIS